MSVTEMRRVETCKPIKAGTYFTDDERLYRVLSSSEEYTTLENCARPDELVPMVETASLYGESWRLVTPQAA